MAQGATSRRRNGRRLILRFDGEGDDAAVWAWLSEQPDREAAAKAALLAAATGTEADRQEHPDPSTAPDHRGYPAVGLGNIVSVATLADQVAKLINILDRVTLAGGGAPRPIGMSLGPAEPIQPFQVTLRSDPPASTAETAAATEVTTVDQQVDQKIAKLLRFGDDLFGGEGE